MRLQDKVAVVTGAASGMGKSIAEVYANEGANVVLVDLNFEGVEEVAKVALFLASDDSSFVNGDVIVADAGWTAAF